MWPSEIASQVAFYSVFLVSILSPRESSGHGGNRPLGADVK